jgi:uncharacterized protein (DUF58 family)
MRGLRLTRSGVALVAGSVTILGVGIVSHYGEMVALAGLAAVVLVVAAVVPRIASRVQLRRRMSRRLLQRGDELEVVLRIRSRGPLSGLRIVDRLDRSEIPIDIAHLERGRAIEARYKVRPRRRGVRVLGPIGEERSDPFGLAVRTAEHPVLDEILVHPVIHRLGPVLHGNLVRQQALSRRRRSDDPMAEFRSLRAYVPGDDPRRIHWPTSARVGQPVVRDFLEQRHTLRLVLLETLEPSISDTLFEEAAEIAASLAIDAWEQGLGCVSRTRDPDAIGNPSPVRDPNEVLVQFARVRRTPEAETTAPNVLLRGIPAVDQVYCVCGLESPLLRALNSTARFRSYLKTVHLVTDLGRGARVGPSSVSVRSAEEFAARWRAGKVS